MFSFFCGNLHLFQTKSNHKTDNIYIISDYLFFSASAKRILP